MKSEAWLGLKNYVCLGGTDIASLVVLCQHESQTAVVPVHGDELNCFLRTNKAQRCYQQVTPTHFMA